MEGGNKVQLNLEAGLDISSSDMIVPFNAQTFQHNWQKWQGKCLPNSLRFERNGWAAGWNVYDFEYSPFVVKFEDYAVRVEKLASNMYMAYAYDIADEEFLEPKADYRIVTESKILSGAATLERVEGVDVVSGVVSGFNGGKLYYELTWSPLTEEFEYDDTDIAVEQSVKDGIVTVEVTNKQDSFEGDLHIFVASPLTFKYAQPIAYTGFENNIHTWGDYALSKFGIGDWKIKTPTSGDSWPVTNVRVSKNHLLEFDYTEVVQNDENAFENFFDFTGTRNNTGNSEKLAKYGDIKELDGESYTLNLTLDKFYTQFTGVRAGMDGVKADADGKVVMDSGAKDASFNKIQVKVINSDASLRPNSSLLLDVVVPIWWTVGLERAGDSWEYVVRHQGKDVTDRYDISELSSQVSYYIQDDWNNGEGYGKRMFGYRDGHHRATAWTDYHMSVRAKDTDNTYIDTADFYYLPTFSADSINLTAPAIMATFDATAFKESGVLQGITISDGDHDRWSDAHWNYSTTVDGTNSVKLLGAYAYGERAGNIKTASYVDDTGVNHFASLEVDPTNGAVLNGAYMKKEGVELEMLTAIPGIIQDFEQTDDHKYYYGFTSNGKDYVVPKKDVITDIKTNATYCYWYTPVDFVGNQLDSTTISSAYVLEQHIDDNNTKYVVARNNSTGEVYAREYFFWDDEVFGVFKDASTNQLVPAFNKDDSSETYIYEIEFSGLKWYCYNKFNDRFIPAGKASANGRCYIKADEWFASIGNDLSKVDFDELCSKIVKLDDMDKYFNTDQDDLSTFGQLKDEYNYNKKPETVTSTDPEAYAYIEIAGPNVLKAVDNIEAVEVIKQRLETLELMPEEESSQKFRLACNGTAYELGTVFTAGAIIEGHILLKLEYARIGTTQELMDESEGALVLSQVASNSEDFEYYIRNVASFGTNKFIFVDRDKDADFIDAVSSVGTKAILADKLFTIARGGAIIDDNQGSGYLTCSITPASGDVMPLTFGVKNDSAGVFEEANYSVYLPERVLTAFKRADNRNVTASAGMFSNFKTVIGHTSEKGKVDLKIEWRPTSIEAPTNVSAALKVNNRKAFTHDIFTKRLIKLQNALCSIGEIDPLHSAGVVIQVAIKSGKDKYVSAIFMYDFASGNITFEQWTWPNKSSSNLNDVDRRLYDGEDGYVEFDQRFVSGMGMGMDFLDNKVGHGAQAFIPLKIVLNYPDCKASFPAAAESTQNLKLIKSDGDIVWLVDKNEQDMAGGTDNESSKHVLRYSMVQRRFLESMVTVDRVDYSDEDPQLQHVYYTLAYKERFSAMMRAVYDKHGSVITNAVYDEHGSVIADAQVQLKYKGADLFFDEANMTGHNYDVLAYSTDIREPNTKKKLGSISPEGQIQLLKQAWNTTADTENYWWIDRNHILELTPRYFILKRNTRRLHDWNGDVFKDVYRIPRADCVSGNVYRYFVSSAFKETSAVFWTVEPVTGGIQISVYDVIRKFKKLYSFTIYMRHRELGEELNEGPVVGANHVYFNTYSQLTAEAVLSKAEWSSTIVNDKLIIGCHVSNNFNQWAIVIDLGALSKGVNPLARVIQGYGYVGLHGELTGGMIPAEFFECKDNNAKGFTGTVQPLSVLDKKIDKNSDNIDAPFEITSPYDINEVKTQVVGTAEQQWYIKKRLHGVVSHIEYVDDPEHDDGFEFEPRIVPITNNYESLYASPSFYSSVVGDCMAQVSALYDLITFPSGMNTAWRTLCGFMGYPLVYNFAPRFSNIVYLQQSLGQYAYVHYNSSRSVPEKDNNKERISNGFDNGGKEVGPTLNSAFIFDKQKVSQSGNISLDYFKSGAVSLLLAAFSETLQVFEKKQSVNEEQNAATFTDKSKQFIENVVENTGNMLSTAIVTQSKSDVGLTSTVTGLKSLDMFYSTSDSQRVFAGPGFTELQFVADCVAQSVTDTQVEGHVTQLFINIKALTMLQMQLVLKIESYLADQIEKKAKATSYSIAGAMTALSNPGAIAAIALYAVAGAMRIVKAAQEVAIELVGQFLDGLAKNAASTDSLVPRHALSVEGKHKYGEKNEVFMWPCWGVPIGQLKYTDESVVCGVKNTPWELALHASKYYTSVQTNWANIIVSQGVPNMSDNKSNTSQMSKVGSDGDYTSTDGNRGVSDIAGDNYRAYRHEGKVPFYQIAPYGEVVERILPDDMAKIEGVSRILPSVPFKNENIAVSDPAFAPSLIHDYILDKDWQLSLCATYGLQQWVAVKDTKILNGPPSNIVVDGEFCGVASPYAAIELRRGIEREYMRPLAITPNALALNCTGYNTLYDDQLYHSFDGMSCRLVDLVGSPGLNKNKQSFYYAIQVNDRFKRSNIIPAQEMQGNFETEPVLAMDTIDKLWTKMTIAADEKGLEAGTVGEDKDAVRWAIPVFTEPVSTLPACVKTLTAATLAVVEGVTGLVTAQVTDTNSAYKAPTSVDFSIGKNVYRATEEYICSVTPANGGNIIKEIIPTLGLKFIGSTPTEAYFYSKATRCYYVFTGSNLVKIDMMERFRDIQRGYWDFVNQEVVMPCLMTFKRLNAEVEDKDTETDNVIVPVLSKGQVSGELPPPLTTIFNDRSWYKCLSLPSGFAYQGPNRVIINRSVFTEYMLDGIKRNLGNWKKVPREKYSFNREYGEKYASVNNVVNENFKKGVDGWTYNPFLLVTSALGVREDVDCLFEWEVTFCWPVEMDLLYSQDNYAVVNILAETMTPGGKRESRPTHVFLTKELFTRDGNYGYYSFRFQSKNGAGNRERLKIWSDQYIAVSSVACEYKVVSQRRTEQLTQQIDVSGMKEL